MVQPKEPKGEERNVETGMTTVRASERETSTSRVSKELKAGSVVGCRE